MRHRLVASLVLVMIASRAMADRALDARFFDARGRVHYEARRFDRALDAFLGAHHAAPSNTTRFNVALSAELAGRPALAWTFYEELLREAPDDARSVEARARQLRLEEGLAIVEIATTPPSATIHLDRAELGSSGRSPIRLVVDAGGHRVVAKLEGHADAEVDVVATTGRIASIHVALPTLVGQVELVGMPEGSHITFERDDGLVRETDASTITLPVGIYAIRVDSGDHVVAPTTAVVRESRTTRVPLNTRPIARPRGRLVVRSHPPARLYVDGVARATTPVVLSDVPEGEHELVLRARGRVDWSGRRAVVAGSSTRIEVNLDAAR